VSATEERTELPGALAMARDWALRVSEIAAHYARRDEAEPGMGAIEAHIQGAGKAQFEAAQMASFMALVSLAEDVHRITEVLVRTDAKLTDVEREEREPEP
jgi:hypothetical protein